MCKKHSESHVCRRAEQVRDDAYRKIQVLFRRCLFISRAAQRNHQVDTAATTTPAHKCCDQAASCRTRVRFRLRAFARRPPFKTQTTSILCRNHRSFEWRSVFSKILTPRKVMTSSVHPCRIAGCDTLSNVVKVSIYELKLAALGDERLKQLRIRGENGTDKHYQVADLVVNFV